jgi:hypothetical protein
VEGIQSEKRHVRDYSNFSFVETHTNPATGAFITITGNVMFHILFDTEGDHIPGGTFVEELGVDVHGPHIDDSARSSHR